MPGANESEKQQRLSRCCFFILVTGFFIIAYKLLYQFCTSGAAFCAIISTAVEEVCFFPPPLQHLSCLSRETIRHGRVFFSLPFFRDWSKATEKRQHLSGCRFFRVITNRRCKQSDRLQRRLFYSRQGSFGDGMSSSSSASRFWPRALIFSKPRSTAIPSTKASGLKLSSVSGGSPAASVVGPMMMA